MKTPDDDNQLLHDQRHYRRLVHDVHVFRAVMFKRDGSRSAYRLHLQSLAKSIGLELWRTDPHPQPFRPSAADFSIDADLAQADEEDGLDDLHYFQTFHGILHAAHVALTDGPWDRPLYLEKLDRLAQWIADEQDRTREVADGDET